MWPLFSVLAIFYAALFLFKNKYHVLSEQIYEKYGLDIGLFQIKLSLSAKRRWVTNIPTMKKCKNFYKYGTIISLVLIIPSLAFLVWNLYKIINLAWSSTISISDKDENSDSKLNNIKEELIFQPVLPGVTFPMSEFGVYGFSLLLSTVFHELGHALAADCQDVKILGYGILIFFIIPAAYVDLSTAELTSLSLTDQLKVYTAGIWHNLVLSLIAFLLLFTLPTLISKPFYHYKTDGVAILQLNLNSSVNGPSGLAIGQVITAVNDCKVNKVSDFYGCIKTEAHEDKGFCLPKTLIQGMDCGGQECCEKNKNNGTFLNFKGKSVYCLPVRLASNSSVQFCKNQDTEDSENSNFSCLDDYHECVKPVLPYLHEKLWLMKRRKDQKDFLFIGFSTDLLSGIEILSDYVPKYDILPVGLPVLIEKGLYYTCSFSLALALINIVPCVMLDGQFIIKTLMQISCSHTKAFYFSSIFIYLGSGLLLTNLLLTFMLL